MLTISTKWQTLTFKRFFFFLWLAGWRNSSTVFFHWRNEWLLSEFILLGPLADATTGLVNLINQSFHFNRGEGQKQNIVIPISFLILWEWFWTQQHAGGLIDQCWRWCQGVLLGSHSQPLLTHQLTILWFQHALLQSDIWAQNQCTVWVFNQTLCMIFSCWFSRWVQ